MKACFALAILSFASLSRHATAQEAPDRASLIETGRASAWLLLDYLKQNTDEDFGVWLPPHIIRNVKYVGTGTFREVKYPINKVAGHRDAWRWVKRPTVEDPYNKVYEKYKQPIYKKVGERTVKQEIMKASEVASSIVHWFRWHNEAINGLCAYALLEAGVLSSDQHLRRAITFLREQAEEGLPDNTVDLALITLVFMKSNSERHKKDVFYALRKLLRGQIDDGKARGLWGYYSVNWDDLVFLRAQRDKLDTYAKDLRLPPKINENAPKSKQLTEKLSKKAEIDQALKWLDNQERTVTREFGLGRIWFKTRRVTQTNEEGDDIRRYSYYPRTIYDARVERVADLLSTQIALYAIAEAHRLGFLNEDFINSFAAESGVKLKKVKGKVKAHAFPDTNRILARTASLLKKRQDKTGTWSDITERIKHKNPYKEMRDIDTGEFRPYARPDLIKNHAPLGIDPKRSNTFGAMHCLAMISEVVGLKTMEAKYKSTIDSGIRQIDSFYKDILNGKAKDGNSSIAFFPFLYFLAAADINQQFKLPSFAEKRNMAKLLAFLLRRQNEDGTFNKPADRRFRSVAYPHPYLPEQIRQRWFKKKWVPSVYEQIYIDSPMVSNALVVLIYKKLYPSLLKHDPAWKTAFEDFSALRNTHFGIRSESIIKAEEEAAKAAAKAEAPEKKEADREVKEEAPKEAKVEEEAPLGDITPETPTENKKEDEAF